MGKYDKIVDAKVSKTGQYFKEGQYRVRIIAVKDVDSQLGKNFTVIETEVLESNNPEIQVGSERSQVIDMGQVMGFPNLKAFMGAACGIDPTDPDINNLVEDYFHKNDPNGVHRTLPEIMEHVVIDRNIFEDTVMELECVNITTKAEKKPFTKHVWHPREDA